MSAAGNHDTLERTVNENAVLDHIAVASFKYVTGWQTIIFKTGRTADCTWCAVRMQSFA